MTDASQAPIGDVKAWYASRTIWGAILAGVAPILALLFRTSIDAATVDQAASALAALGAGVGAVIAIYGRIKAGKAIGAFGAPLILAGALALGACAMMTNPNGTPMTPAQKFSAACDGYWAGKDAIGPLIKGIAARDATSAAVYSDAVFTLNTACQKNPDGTYVEANGPNLAALLPKVLQAGGYLTVLFLPKAP